MAAPIEHLRRVSLFSGLDTTELTPIASLATRRSFDPRAVIVQQADPGGELFVIVEGHVKVISAGVDGRDSGLNIMGPGDVFGEVSLLDGGPRSATVAALDHCALLSIKRDPFMQFLEGSPKTAIELLKVLTGLLRKLTERSEDVAFLRVGGRLAKRIAGIAERYGERRADASLRVPFKLSQQEIGDLVNATRESANKQLKAWEDSGLLSHDHGHLVVHDLERLRAEGGDI
jgi:CRP-like cAMP-binding protein